jgi:formylglycine-generating enzyme required for sulfatase activity
LAALAMATVASVPEVENVQVKQNAGGALYVTYELSDKAIVTMDICTNGVSIGAENFAELKGAVNRIVDPDVDTLKIKWDPRKTWSGLPLDNVVFKLRAWSTNSPPDYLVYDFVNHTTNFYVSAEALPDGGLANDVYKTDRIVLRKIPAKNVEWMMGSSPHFIGYGDSTMAHSVVLSEDFYIAIYEMTQAQYRHAVKAENLEKQTYAGEDADVHPADAIRYWKIRGSTAWPAQGRTTPGSGMDDIRKRTGIDFDLPTEAQWEFACRAGTKTQLYSGRNMTIDGKDPEVQAIAWTKYDTTTSQPVGLKEKNAWGLYDMCGNVQEWCCDYYAAYASSDAMDPAGSPTDTGVGRVLRGGGFGWSESRVCTSVSRSNDNGKGAMKDRGFRLICPVTLKW